MFTCLEFKDYFLRGLFALVIPLEDIWEIWRPAIRVSEQNVAVDVPILANEEGYKQSLEGDQPKLDHLRDEDLQFDEHMVSLIVLSHRFVRQGCLLLQFDVSIDQRKDLSFAKEVGQPLDSQGFDYP